MQRYKQLTDIVKFVKPETIIEIGTHNGKRAYQFVIEAIKHRKQVHYIGYDLFENANEQTDAQEMNGKGAGSMAIVQEKLDRIKQSFPGFTYELVKGNTRDTLHGTSTPADFVYIDGGHSVETIRGDYEAVKLSRVIAFDDYYIGKNAPTDRWGCNEVIKDVQHVLMPIADQRAGVKVAIAVIGYDPKWVEAMESCRTFHQGIDTISQWRGEPVMLADMVACINILEKYPDVTEAIAQVKQWVYKRIFFVIKEDSLRSIERWREILDKHFRVEQWFGHGGEVCGTAIPLLGTDKIKSFGAWSNDRRFENIKTNISTVSKRLKLERDTKHDKRCIIVCYGPSLKQTWNNIIPDHERDGAAIVSVSGAHDFLIDNDIIPHYHVECDPRPHKAKNLEKPHKDVEYYIASACHPDLVNKLVGYNQSLWHIANGEDSIRQIAEIEPGGIVVMGGGNAGLRAISIFYALGYRWFSLYGMDCSFSDKGETQHAGKHFGSRQKLIEIKTGDRWFISSAVLMSYVEHFHETMRQAPDAIFDMHGDGLLQYNCQCRLEEGARQRAAKEAAE